MYKWVLNPTREQLTVLCSLCPDAVSSKWLKIINTLFSFVHTLLSSHRLGGGGGWCVPIMGLCSLVIHNPLCQVSRHHGNYMLNKQHGSPGKGGTLFSGALLLRLVCAKGNKKWRGCKSPRVRAGAGPRNPATLSVGINSVKCSHETQSRAAVFKLWNTKGTARTCRPTCSHILTE